MLTHAIRALSLVGLILIAHTIKPFSLGSVAAFTRQTLRSLSFALPEEAMQRLERTGELVALLGSGWSDASNSPARLADKLLALKSSFSEVDSDQVASLKAKAARKQLDWAGKASRRSEKVVRSLQARNQTGSGTSFGAAPLPSIPGIEASLIPSATLMALPSFHTAASDTAEDSQELFPSQFKLLNLDCEWRLGFETKTWIPEETLLKLQEAQFPAPNVKLRIFNQRPSKSQACSQSGKATDAHLGNGKQSC
jgi:hypothetical protein